MLNVYSKIKFKVTVLTEDIEFLKLTKKLYDDEIIYTSCPNMNFKVSNTL